LEQFTPTLTYVLILNKSNYENSVRNVNLKVVTKCVLLGSPNSLGKTFNETLIIYPKKEELFRKEFGSKILGITIGARTEDQSAWAMIKEGGVSQKFVVIAIHAGKGTTEALIKIIT
jgi:hypothetical protein